MRRPGWCYAGRPNQVHGRPRPPTSACDHIKLQTFFDGARLALCCGPRRVGRDMRVGLLLVRPINQMSNNYDRIGTLHDTAGKLVEVQYSLYDAGRDAQDWIDAIELRF